MKLHLPRHRPIGPALVALAAGLTGEAAAQLAGYPVHPEEAVHGARVALKRARSTLRLLEKAGAAWAIMPRYRLAELASRMSAEREAAVTVSLALGLSRRRPAAVAEVWRLLAARAGRAGSAGTAHLQRLLLEESRQLAIAPPPVITRAQLHGLLRRSLERAARRHYAAVRNPSHENVHEWRKAVIILRDQTALAAARWPEGAGRAHPRLVRLARRLGRRGDLALLVRQLQHLRVRPALSPARRRLIRTGKAELAQETLGLLLDWLPLEPRLHRLLADH